MKAMIENIKSRLSSYKTAKYLIFEDLAVVSLCAVLIFVPFSGYVVKRALYATVFFLLIAKGLAWKTERKAFLSKHFMNWPWLLFILSLVLANTFSPERYESWKFFAERILMYVFAFWAAKELLVDRARINILVWVLFVSASVVALDCLWQFFTGKDFFFGHPIVYKGKALTGPLGRHNYLSGYLEMVVPFVAILTLAKRKITKALLWLAISGLLFFSLIYSFQRGVLLSVMLSIFLVILLLKKRLLFIAPVLVLLVMVALPQDFKQRFTDYINFSGSSVVENVDGNEDKNIFKAGWSTGRVYMWKVAYKMFRQRPILGHGLDAYNRYYNSGIDPKMPCSYAHNTYFQLAAEAGLLGLISFVALLCLYFWKIIKKIIREKEYNQRVLLCAFVASNFSTVISGLYSSNMLVGIGFSLMFWILMAAGSNIVACKTKTS